MEVKTVNSINNKKIDIARDKKKIEQAYQKMYNPDDLLDELYADDYRSITEIASAYQLPIRCPISEKDRNSYLSKKEKVHEWAEEHNQFIGENAFIMDTLYLKSLKKVFFLNQFFERFKTISRYELFSESYLNTPMFYEKNGKWFFGPRMTWKQFKDNNFTQINQAPKKLNIFPRKNLKYSTFTNNDIEHTELGKPHKDIWGRDGYGNKLYDRNAFIEGILNKKKGKKEAIFFLKERLLPTDVFYSHIDDYLQDKIQRAEVRKIIVEKFKEAIKALKIRPIKYDNTYYFWYEDYAMFPSICIDLSDGPWHLPLEFFFRNKIKENDYIKDNYIIGSDYFVFHYIFLFQSGLVRNTMRILKQQEEIEFFKFFSNFVLPKFDSKIDHPAVANSKSNDFVTVYNLLYPLFRVNTNGSIDMLPNEGTPLTLEESPDWLMNDLLKTDEVLQKGLE